MIRVMEPDLVAQIKAGEVIERPASVVKELVENALDAGSRRIRVEVLAGGTHLIRVIDDGVGIAPDELPLAFGEHTSSKLHSTAGLDHIETLGFRGEALYAVSNVARVEAISCLRGASTAASVVFDDGRLILQEPAAPGGGTRIAVHDLFAKVPARRKHLRSARSETAAIHQVVSQYAIGHAEVAISLIAENRPVLTSPGTGTMVEAFASVYGPDLVDNLVSVQVDGPVSISGLVSSPHVTRSNRSAILLFVNGRPVRSPALVFAIEDAYSGLLMAGRHPLAALAINLPPDQVDPNIHPAKLEVRFLADRPVFSAARSAVLKALDGADRVLESALDAGPIGQISPRFVPESPRHPYPEQVSFEEPARPPAAPAFADALPALRVFGQAAQTFIIAEGPAGLYMIDQHAAHERVLFDTLTTGLERAVSQPLLEPVRLELTPDQWVGLEDHLSELVSLGFEVEPFGDRVCAVRSLPVTRGREVVADVLSEVLDALAGARSPEDVVNRTLTVVACKAAVKAGQTLSMAEMRELVSSLERTPNPRTCPHGRPTTIHISTERLEREFGRR